MFEFFRGWKRKAGVVTLVMACFFVSAWARTIGQANQDLFSYTRNLGPRPEDQVVHYFRVTHDSVQWESERLGTFKDYKTWQVPHYSTAIALTLLSAWLLLSPRAKPTPQSIGDGA